MIWGAPMTKRNPPLSHGCSILIPVSSALNHHTSFQVPAAAPVVALSYLGSRLFGPAMAEVFFGPKGYRRSGYVWIMLCWISKSNKIRIAFPCRCFFCVFWLGVFGKSSLTHPIKHILNFGVLGFWGVEHGGTSVSRKSHDTTGMLNSVSCGGSHWMPMAGYGSEVGCWPTKGMLRQVQQLPIFDMNLNHIAAISQLIQTVCVRIPTFIRWPINTGSYYDHTLINDTINILHN